MRAKSLQSCLTLCDAVDCSPPGSSVHGILQARTLEYPGLRPRRGGRQRPCWVHRWLGQEEEGSRALVSVMGVREQGSQVRLEEVGLHECLSSGQERMDAGRVKQYNRLSDHLFPHLNKRVTSDDPYALSHVTHSCPTLCNTLVCGQLRLLCPWDFSGKNTGVGYHFLLQRILLTQKSNSRLLCLMLGRQGLSTLSHRRSASVCIKHLLKGPRPLHPWVLPLPLSLGAGTPTPGPSLPVTPHCPCTTPRHLPPWRCRPHVFRKVIRLTRL